MHFTNVYTVVLNYRWMSFIDQSEFFDARVDFVFAIIVQFNCIAFEFFRGRIIIFRFGRFCCFSCGFCDFTLFSLMDFCPFSFNNCRIKIQDFPLVFILTESMNFLSKLALGNILTFWSSTIFALLFLAIFNGETVCRSMSGIFPMLRAIVLFLIFITRRIGIVGIIIPSPAFVGLGG